MEYINGGKSDGATLLTGGEQHGTEGYYIQPTIFTDVKPDMRIVKEEIFGPVGVIIKFKTEDGTYEPFLVNVKDITDTNIILFTRGN